MVRAVEFQTAGDVGATVWETQCRFVLVDGKVIVVHVDEPHTRAEVEELITEVEETSGVSLADGVSFLVALGDYDDGSHYARMRVRTGLDIERALSTADMVPVDADDGEEASVELIGHLVRQSLAGVSAADV